MLDDDKGFGSNVLCFSLEACIALFGCGWLPFFESGIARISGSCTAPADFRIGVGLSDAYQQCTSQAPSRL
jgi:hypothetical protein